MKRIPQAQRNVYKNISNFRFTGMNGIPDFYVSNPIQFCIVYAFNIRICHISLYFRDISQFTVHELTGHIPPYCLTDSPMDCFVQFSLVYLCNSLPIGYNTYGD